jgi:hypothetical protein
MKKRNVFLLALEAGKSKSEQAHLVRASLLIVTVESQGLAVHHMVKQTTMPERAHCFNKDTHLKTYSLTD